MLKSKRGCTVMYAVGGAPGGTGRVSSRGRSKRHETSFGSECSNGTRLDEGVRIPVVAVIEAKRQAWIDEAGNALIMGEYYQLVWVCVLVVSHSPFLNPHPPV